MGPGGLVHGTDDSEHGTDELFPGTDDSFPGPDGPCLGPDDRVLGTHNMSNGLKISVFLFGFSALFGWKSFEIAVRAARRSDCGGVITSCALWVMIFGFTCYWEWFRRKEPLAR